MSKLTISSTCTNGPLYQIIIDFENGWPSEQEELNCELLQTKNGKITIATEASGIVYAGSEENYASDKKFILARNRMSGKVRLIEARRAMLQPVYDDSDTSKFENIQSATESILFQKESPEESLDFEQITNDSLERHINRHNKTVCSKDSIHIKNEIILDSNTDSESNFICNDCGRTFKRKPFLIAHIAVHDMKTVKSKSINKKHQCTTCEEAFATQSDLINHGIKVHKDKQDYKCCTICNYKTTLTNRLTVHMRVHTGQTVFKCIFCDYGSKTIKELKVHELTHLGVKPYECKLCFTRFTQRNGLKHHMNVHSGDKPHKCTYCDSAFAQPSGLRRHLIIHTGEKPYKCTTCNKSFSDSSSLKRHETTHTKIKPYECSECGSKFTSNQNLKKHVRIH